MKRQCEVVHWRTVSPRLLYAVLRLQNGASIVVLVAHAPHSLAGEGVRGLFWDEMWNVTHMLRGKYADPSLRVALDSNGRMGSVASAFIGPVEPAKEDAGGACLRVRQ